MRYVDLPKPGGPENFILAEGPVPSPKAGEIVIRVEAAGVNRPDLMQRAGEYAPPADASSILGLEVAGTVAVASGKWKVGDRVCALVHGGGYAEYSIAAEAQALKIPEGISMEEAGGFPETYFTVWANVFQIGRLSEGEWLLVHGGTSGIGTTAIQLALALGAKVIATAGSDGKCEAIRALGGEAINYKTEDFVAEVKRITGDKGANVVLDMIGGPYTPKNIDCLAKDGRIVQIATQQGPEVMVDLRKLMAKRGNLTGSLLRPRTGPEKAAIAKGLEEKVLPLWAAKKVKVLVDKTFPMEKVADAHRYLEAGEHVGKVILRVNEGQA
ncbi:MAG: NAD(P)H-quinone oxidoreductase [Proteobacteria bacterium]|nr:MAG: NAD(P)H-quinone oxidoreductase [Pseudomonadota bacterium]